VGSFTITVCSSFLIFVLLTSVVAFSASQNNAFLPFADGTIDSSTSDEIEFDSDSVDEVNITNVSPGVVVVAE